MLDLPVEAPDLVLYRGDDRVQEYVLSSGGAPVPTLGWNFVCQVRIQGKPQRVSVPVNDTEEPPEEGRIVLSFPASLFAELGTGKFDVEGERGGQILTFVRGRLVVTDDVTRREP